MSKCFVLFFIFRYFRNSICQVFVQFISELRTKISMWPSRIRSFVLIKNLAGIRLFWYVLLNYFSLFLSIVLSFDKSFFILHSLINLFLLLQLLLLFKLFTSILSCCLLKFFQFPLFLFFSLASSLFFSKCVMLSIRKPFFIWNLWKTCRYIVFSLMSHISW